MKLSGIHICSVGDHLNRSPMREASDLAKVIDGSFDSLELLRLNLEISGGNQGIHNPPQRLGYRALSATKERMSCLRSTSNTQLSCGRALCGRRRDQPSASAAC